MQVKIEDAVRGLFSSLFELAAVENDRVCRSCVEDSAIAAANTTSRE